MTDIIVARYNRGSSRFEVVIEPEKALLFRAGKAALADALRFPAVYTDARKGEKAPAAMLKNVFGTDDVNAVAEQIIKKGDVPQSKSQREEQLRQVRSRIVDLLHRSGVDPRTHAPHPRTRLETAMGEAGVDIDPARPAEAQLQDVLKALRPIIPIKQEMHQLRVQVPAGAVGAALNVVKGTGHVLREGWNAAGDLDCLVEIPGGLSIDFQDALMAATHGKAQFTVLKRE